MSWYLGQFAATGHLCQRWKGLVYCSCGARLVVCWCSFGSLTRFTLHCHRHVKSYKVRCFNCSFPCCCRKVLCFECPFPCCCCRGYAPLCEREVVVGSIGHLYHGGYASPLVCCSCSCHQQGMSTVCGPSAHSPPNLCCLVGTSFHLFSQWWLRMLRTKRTRCYWSKAIPPTNQPASLTSEIRGPDVFFLDANNCSRNSKRNMSSFAFPMRPRLL